MLSHSQLQVKEMHPAALRGRELVRLPLHQDPSFLSLLIHAREPPSGLQVQVDDHFLELSSCGPGIATVLLGQLFHFFVCRRSFAKGRHRVVTRAEDMQKRRISATFFFQPSPETLLRPLRGSSEEPTLGRLAHQSAFEHFKANFLSNLIKSH